MASCEHPEATVDPMCDDGDDTNASGDEVRTPISRNKNKRKETDEGGSSKKARSWVWDHFTKKIEDKDRASCNYCGKEMASASKSGTTSLSKHLNLACKSFQVWQAANRFGTQGVMSPVGEDGDLMVCKKEAMKKILGENKQRLSLTTDIWTAPYTRASYMVITAHFVDAGWKLRKLIIGFKNVVDHKGSTISKVLLDCLEEWGIKRVFCITVDNATANGSAMTRFKEGFKEIGDDVMVLEGRFLHIRCDTHVLNLIVKEGLREADNSINAIRNGILYVRSSTQRQIAFEQRVESGKLQRGSLPLDVTTRWNSTYLMLEQAMKFKVAFEKMEAEDKPYNDYFNEFVQGEKRIGPPTKVDWEAVDRLVQFLIIFYQATLVLSASTSVCAHKFYHAIYTVTRNISGLSTAPGPNAILRSKAASMLGKLGKYWDPFGEKVEMNKLIIVAGVLDPTKKMKFVTKCFENLYGKESVEATQLAKETEDILRDLFNEYNSIYNANKNGGPGSTIASHHSQSQGTSSQSQDLFVEEVSQRTVLGNGVAYESMNDIYEELGQEAGFQEKTNELDIYLKESAENHHVMNGTEYDVHKWSSFGSKLKLLDTLHDRSVNVHRAMAKM
ncbi:PREDICTED: zinc finger BED domain-containing protein RICESLEEPER 2-like [Brassica oleracea var. oleracea]|uniref:zinc finger BED domain-containing protein RICESLEEPER 2-like n=1 Tax=Brassica oleracea var. oleracea TaxID=109376 RepID=UPI0006A70B1B|nr:PREDICTED: zinc finger BED domain-containing protein RICESLEEPER 2-like [Brassica oleracea var. oleracea]